MVNSSYFDENKVSNLIIKLINYFHLSMTQES